MHAGGTSWAMPLLLFRLSRLPARQRIARGPCYSDFAMRYVLWILKLGLFALMLTFAVKNTEPVTVRYLLGQQWEAPLIFVLLIFFCLGAALGLLAALGHILRQRREIATLKRELRPQSELEPPAPDLA
jgi:lipopolysaccharide assembly protein A